jgi:hypothetical protein
MPGHIGGGGGGRARADLGIPFFEHVILLNQAYFLKELAEAA